jgi:hypothetical protein
MAAKCWLIKRSGTYYSFEGATGKRTSLKTKNKSQADQIIATMNAPAQNAALNLTLAKVYLRNSDPAVARAPGGPCSMRSSAIDGRSRRCHTFGRRSWNLWATFQ